ncbi:hypothetical protein QEJ31_05915 [Pigmentibacter sp. JX0631]|uniref:hypothetical protein n=1 Tax=Pigmentibacter sp. JX0631 TaxID=2976982 RepID=UPI0024693AC2|nr:hypothetical protein [Pigmentibacter sp. JX0631]WGL61131.1 hypothetical protein QEJ31_05915 [Pigmentibacter sp. JX0631]
MYLENDANKLSHPKQLTRQNHSEILHNLRRELANLQKQKVVEPGVLKMRVRNWLFFVEEGESIVDIILDKGYSLSDIEANKSPRLADTNLSFDECTEVHKYFMESTVFEPFTDDVNIRVGSPGSEPTLYDLEDFQASIGDVITVETWQKISGRSKFTMVINEICDNKDSKVIVLVEGSHRFEVPIEEIKIAFVLPFHPASKSVKLAKDAARQKARQGALKKIK